MLTFPVDLYLFRCKNVDTVYRLVRHNLNGYIDILHLHTDKTSGFFFIPVIGFGFCFLLYGFTPPPRVFWPMLLHIFNSQFYIFLWRWAFARNLKFLLFRYIESTSTFLYFDLYFNTANAAHYILLLHLKDQRVQCIVILSVQSRSLVQSLNMRALAV